MSNENNFDTLLMIGVLKALKERELLTEEEMFECIKKIEGEDTNVESSSILPSVNRQG